MKLRLTVVSAASALAALTACSGSNQPAEPTPSQVAAQIGATGVQPIEPTMFADKEASANLNGVSVDIVTFTTKEKRDNWVKVAGFSVTVIKQGPLWAVAK